MYMSDINVNLTDYCDFLSILSAKINKDFEEQKEYIHCAEGCSLCCKNGEYPCSELEFELLKVGISSLPGEVLEQIFKNIESVKKEKNEFKGKTFSYKCPFLINDRCSVYPYRMIVCLTFGLSYFVNENGENRIKTPFCVEHGLNYSDVYDFDKKEVSTQLYKAKGYKNEPLAYNLSLDFIINNLGKECMKLDFGEEKALIDWL